METETYQDVLPNQLPVLYASYPFLNAIREFLSSHPVEEDTGKLLHQNARNLAETCAEIAQRPDQPVDSITASLLRTSFVCLLLAVHDITDVVSFFPSSTVPDGIADSCLPPQIHPTSFHPLSRFVQLSSKHIQAYEEGPDLDILDTRTEDEINALADNVAIIFLASFEPPSREPNFVARRIMVNHS
jgi:hypothetical protein